MNKGLISGLVLLTLGLICGALLAGVNALTAPIITDMENQVKYDALADFYTIADYDLVEVPVVDANIDTVYLFKNKTTGTVEAAVYSVKAYGYQSEVKMLIAVNQDFTVQGYKIVSQAETAGLGSLSETHDFKMTGAVITDLSGFDSISGATITSTAVKACFIAVGNHLSVEFGGGN